MDTHTLTLVLGIFLAAVGAYMTFMTFSGRRFSAGWKPAGVSEKMNPEMAKRLIKTQSLIVLVIGTDLLISSLTGYDPLAQILTALHL
jgi:hypothetical protein